MKVNIDGSYIDKSEASISVTMYLPRLRQKMQAVLRQ